MVGRRFNLETIVRAPVRRSVVGPCRAKAVSKSYRETYAQEILCDSIPCEFCGPYFDVLWRSGSALDGGACEQLVLPAALARRQQLQSQHRDQPVGNVAS